MTTSFKNDPVARGTEEPQQQFTFEPSPPRPGNDASTNADDKPASSARGANRLFFPTNREDILLQLSSLAISRDFPNGLTAVPVQDDALALLPDGLRTDEITLLQGGRAGRFPVLVELREWVHGERIALGINEVGALCFRSQSDADDFRFRPVDELNTEEMTCRVDPALFDLPGAARFRNRPQESPELEERGRFSDRIAGGVCTVLELGAIQPTCWHDIAELLCRSRDAAPSNEVTLTRALASGFSPASNGGQADAVLRAFIAHVASDSSSSLVGQVHAHLTDGSEDGGQLRKAERWLDMARAVLQNRARMDEELLSDEGSIALRAALLASVVDDVRALIPFMHASRPAGRKVIVTAAFLIGLRTGVTDMPWAMKRARLDILSPLIVAIQGAVPEARESVGRAFEIDPDETPVGVVLRLLWNDHEVASWQPAEAEARLPRQCGGGDASPFPEPQPAMQADATGSAGATISHDSTAPENTASNSIRGFDGRLIELLLSEPPRQSGVTLRCALSDTDRLRKPKEILEAACTRGLLWRVGVNAEGVAALYADLPKWPDDSLLAELNGALEQALDAYLVKKKTRAADAAARRGKVMKKNSGTGAPPAPVVEQCEE